MSCYVTYNVIVLQDTSSVEIVHKSTVIVVSIHLLDLIDESTALLPRVADLVEPIPQRDQYDLSSWILAVHLANKIDIAAQILLVRNIVVSVVVVGAQVDENNIRLLMMRKVPERWVVAIHHFRSARSIGSSEPLVYLAMHITPAVLIHKTDARICGYVKLDVSQTFG